MNYQNKNLQQKLANDYLMNLMCDRARKRFERLMQTDRELRDTLKQSERHLNSLSLMLPNQTPPNKVWSAIEKQLFRQQSVQTKQSWFERTVEPWLNTKLMLQGWASVATVTSVVLLGQIYFQADRLPASVEITQVNQISQEFIAVVKDAQNTAGWVMNIKQGKLNVAALNAAALPSQKVYELWLIADDLTAPKSLGVITQSGQLSLALSDVDSIHLAQNAKLAVSVEANGGSPTGQPTSVPSYIGGVKMFKGQP